MNKNPDVQFAYINVGPKVLSSMSDIELEAFKETEWPFNNLVEVKLLKPGFVSISIAWMPNWFSKWLLRNAKEKMLPFCPIGVKFIFGEGESKIIKWLKSKTLDKRVAIKEGEMFPDGYLSAYRDYDLNVTVCYPFWFAWPMRVYRSVYGWFCASFRRSEMDRENRRGFALGYKEGQISQMEDEIARLQESLRKHEYAYQAGRRDELHEQIERKRKRGPL